MDTQKLGVGVWFFDFWVFFFKGMDTQKTNNDITQKTKRQRRNDKQLTKQQIKSIIHNEYKYNIHTI